MKKIISTILILTILLSCIPVTVFADELPQHVTVVSEPGIYDADEIIAVNINTFPDSYSNPERIRSFSYKGVSTDKEEISVENEDFPLDDDESLYMVDAVLPVSSDNVTESVENKMYKVGDTKSFIDGMTEESISLKCVYCGTYCTVWTCTSDPKEVQISSENAKKIADKFDKDIYLQMHDAFGEGLDIDGDGKLAIFCFDISSDYANLPSYKDEYLGVYTGGYFWAADMVDRGIDCINIDTFPAMGNYKNNLFANIEDSYSVLAHEFQHLINFSYSAEANLYPMDTYLDEAFAMGAEHLIFGPEFTAERIEYFNDSSRYVQGTPLTIWRDAADYDDINNNYDTLSRYANSYLLGQYIRTRYAQLPGVTGDGSTVFRTILESRDETNDAFHLEELVNPLLNTDTEELLTSFWTALYLKEDSGVYGFNAEEWADNIQPYNAITINSNSSGSRNIANGGAVYCNVPSGKVQIESLGTDIRIVLIVNDYLEIHDDGATDCSIAYPASFESAESLEELSEKTVYIQRDTEVSYTAYAAVYDQYGKMLGIATVTQTGSGQISLVLPEIDTDGVLLSIFVADGQSGTSMIDPLSFEKNN